MLANRVEGAARVGIPLLPLIFRVQSRGSEISGLKDLRVAFPAEATSGICSIFGASADPDMSRLSLL